MTTIRSAIEEARPVWRNIAPEMRRRHTDLVSRVQILADGAIVPIFCRDGFYVVDDGEMERKFDKLAHAEDFVVQRLIYLEVAS